MPPGALVSAVSVVCCQVEVCARSRSLVQRSPTECVCVCVWVWVCARVCVCVCVIECDQVQQ
jgi:hypothetical protein